MSTKRILAPEAPETERLTEASVRPQNLREYVGQHHARETISIVIEAAKQRNESADHIMLYGPPGLGKTTLAQIVAEELQVPFRSTAGPALERTGDLVSLLSTLPTQAVFFIDEIHRLRRPLEEILYPAMEDRRLDVMMGKGPGARSIQLALPPFTLIGATTRLGALSNPLRDRFGTVLHLDYYSEEELVTILRAAADKLQTSADQEALRLIAARSRRTPRLSLRLLRRARDFAAARQQTTHVSDEAVHRTLELLRIDEKGLDELDRRYLRILVEHRRPVGLSTLAASLNEEKETIEDVVEPFLLREGLIQRTPQGRILTTAGAAHLGAELITPSLL